MTSIAHSYYIIQHKETGDCMPAVHGGYSHWKPGQPWEFKREGLDIPRLFSTRRKAMRALHSYCQGERYQKNLNTSGKPWEDYYVWAVRDPRNIKDFEVVKVVLIPYAGS